MKLPDEMKNEIRSKTPHVQTTIHHDYFRHDVIRGLKGNDNIGIELGVAGGHFSKRLVNSGKFKLVFGVDLYEDHHSVDEYKSAIKLIGLEKNYSLLRMSFDEALGLFDDNYFDFIYFDGYAHTGEEGGKTFSDWWGKLKPDGIYAGDDYHDDWPLVIWAVNALAKEVDAKLNITGQTESTNLNHYPSWFFKKSSAHVLTNVIDKELLEIGLTIREMTRKKIDPSNVTITVEQFLNIVDQVSKNHPELATQALEILKIK